MSIWTGMTPQEIVARTIWGECRSGGEAGMSAVANVIMNRANNPRWWGADPAMVCTKPYQFSVWNYDPNPGSDHEATLTVTMADPIFAEAIQIAMRALAGLLPDATENADSYYAVGTPTPHWARVGTYTVTIGGQAFYRTELPPPTKS
ncbi:MAG: cell wall hydrolase [Gallionella sp.]|nr:cell wall hydrolase [Gallionella sp.]MDD4958439.1 cell wall hydrolase [Gallionella sp.]